MAERTSHSVYGKPATTEQEELRRKGQHEKNMKERTSQEADEKDIHPVAKETGYKGASNVGEDLTSGAEGIEDPTDPTSRRD